MNNWETKFNAATLERAKASYKNKRVVDLEKRADGYTAAVLGRQRFEVAVKMKDGRFSRISCQCPVSKAGNFCEHMAAVLYAIEDAEKPEEQRFAEQAARRAAADRLMAEETEKNRLQEEQRRLKEQQLAEEEQWQASRREEQRLARERRKAEKAKKEAEQKKRLEEERRKAAEQQAAEKARREAVRQKKAEEAQKRAEKKRRQEEAQKIADEKRRQEEAQKIAAEKRRQEETQKIADQKHRQTEALRMKYSPLHVPAEETAEAAENSECIARLERYSYFDGTKIKKSLDISYENIQKGITILEQNKLKVQEIAVGYEQYGNEQLGQIQALGKNKKGEFPVQLLFSRTEVKRSACNCPQCRKDYWAYFGGKAKCAYIAAALKYLEGYLQDHSLGDSTDRKADEMLSQYREKRAIHLKSSMVSQEGALRLVPRIIRKKGELYISFRIGMEKLFVVKSLSEFYFNVKNSAAGVYGTSTEFTHSISNFTQTARKWVDYISRYIREEQQIERRLMDARYYSALRKTKNIDSLMLFGGRLDECYELLSGGESFEYEDRDSETKKKLFLNTATGNPKAVMQISPQKTKEKGQFHGIQVSGTLPLLYQGEKYIYYMDEEYFYRADRAFADRLRPLVNMTVDRSYSFQIGRNHMSEFYYQILPDLEDIVEITETEPEKIHSYLPPKAYFIFYLDAEENDVTCRLHARYGDREVSVLDVAVPELEEKIEPFRDANREEEILYQALQWFSTLNPSADELSCEGNEEKMYQIMENGVNVFLSMGEVQCTDRFRNHQMISRVKVSVGVSVSSGLLDLSIATEDIPAAELLELLQSYRLKKKYHRLKDGTFVNLEDPSLEMLAELSDAMHLKPAELAKGKMHLPVYRTLYLDRMLEENESVYSNRDSRFREMAKGFKTIHDSDFEEPESLSRIMRNYQKNGYKWLRTLEAWSFGGILADDMGLGKTLQVIAVLLAAKEEGKTGTSLVVAPASLVFNWGEEFRRFAPELSFVLVTGTAGERQEKIAAYQSADVLITSYDLLKRDIACYEGKQFQYEIIDEAQYIKNHTTAAAKAVKVIKSMIRFALTGTPIENRLSELWSIFDYLMPGFLYGYETFKKEMETPIVKNKDEQAMKRLQKMVSPFILRRLKEDVLRDLPEKLEEIRYVRFDEPQQKLYDAQVLHMKESIAKQEDSEFNKNKMLILAELTKLRQICCDPSLCFENYRGGSSKADACIDLIQSAIDGGHRILLFSQFTSMLEILQKRLEESDIEFFMITGATPKEKRLQMVRAFNEGTVPVFLISLKAGGVGLNLTGADVVIHYDPWWNLAAQNQATDRAHRIGQTKKVTVYKMIAKHSIEEKILHLQETKRDLADQIIGAAGGELRQMNKEELLALLDGK